MRLSTTSVRFLVGCAVLPVLWLNATGISTFAKDCWNLVHDLTASLCFSRARIPVLQGPPVTISPQGDYIRATRMYDGSLVAGYTQTQTDNSGTKQKVLLTAKSLDNGASWSPLGKVFRGNTDEHEIDNSFLFQLPTGRLLYAYRNHDKKKSNNQFKYFRISISYSDDGGVSFRYLSTVDERVAKGQNGLWEPFMRVMRNGSLQCFYSSENNAKDQDGYMRISNDGGMTWGAVVVVVSGEGVQSRDGMIGCAETGRGGEVLCVFEATTPGYFVVDSVVSSDDGITWMDRRRRYTPRNGRSCNGQPFTAGAPQLINVGGTLVMSFMTNEDHDVCNGYDGGDMKVVVSSDAGLTWSEESYVVGASPASWGGIVVLDERRFMALWARRGEGVLGQVVRLE